jgi:hypothetical protein
VTASEFAFMALGLVLGVASGAALIVVLRARPPARREVRVTVAPNSVARRRAATLADASDPSEPSGPARGGPADRRWLDRELPADDDEQASAGRTNVPSRPPLLRLAGAGGNGSRNGSVAITIASEPDPMMAALRATAAASARVLMPSGIETSAIGPSAAASSADPSPAEPRAAARAAGRPAATEAAPAAASLGMASAATDGGEPAAAAAATGGKGGAAPDAAAAPEPAGPCDEPKRIAEERCLVATRAREGAQAALETLRAAQRAYDEHATQADAHAATADPRAVRSAKEAAQHAFRVARTSGRTRDDIEAAARDWLTEINRINLATREAAALAERSRVAATELHQRLERLSLEADAARISAEAADEACVAAREAVAACQEAASAAAAGRAAAPPVLPPLGRPVPDDLPAEDLESIRGSRAAEDAVIIRLLRGDREAMNRLVAQLGGDDSATRRHWQSSIGELLEALVARAIEATAFDFPSTHPFWGPFTRSQCRDIAGALSSLGYRHDGFGSWAEDHVPAQRDLSLAVGYAGLDPMRIRHWPTEAEMGDLLREVRVAADEYIWEAAGSLTLGELVSLLGRRADALTELWNEWGTVRPLLLAVD